MIDLQTPYAAKIIERRQDSPRIFTLKLTLCDKQARENFKFYPGQFNMLYLYGVGEIPISIISDPDDATNIEHTIRPVGRVTRGFEKLEVGDTIGVRGPFGSVWPVDEAENKDVVIITGGLGCAPVVSVIEYMMRRREHFKKIFIMQGIKHSDDFIFQKRYDSWRAHADTEVIIAADQSGPQWPFHTGFVTDHINMLQFDHENTLAFCCGPEAMLHVASDGLIKKGLSESKIFMSMERNMKCAVGHCGHCQYGGSFVCKDGPIFTFAQIRDLFSVAGF